ncbi:MAG: hypothetical protein MIO92_09245, partial [Methanosarcinaceae archaeon]|nr:hypothetical protein [Methanosarcinaceae archaeon]
MKKGIFRRTLKVSLMSLMNFCVIIAIVGCEPERMDSGVSLYVAVDGDDSHQGTIERPFKTLEGARDAIRALRAAGKVGADGVIVNLRGGVYEQAETFVLDQRDSGTERHGIVYKNYGDEEVKIIGGKLLDASAFEKVTDEKILSLVSEEASGQLVQADLKALGINDFGQFGQFGHLMVMPAPLELFFDGQAMQIARYPNEGFVQIGKIVDKGSVPRKGDYSNRGGTF